MLFMLNFAIQIKQAVGLYASILFSTLMFILFLAPGLLVVCLLNKKNIINNAYSLLYVFLFSYLVSYIAGIIYFFDHKAGMIASCFIVLSASIVLLIRWKDLVKIAFDKDFYFPLLILILISVFYILVLYLPSNINDFVVLTRTRFSHGLPCDNELPYLFSDRLYKGISLKPFLGDWLSSDRPPLFAAVITFIRPFAFKDAFLIRLFGVFIQSSWFAGLWGLCKYFEINSKKQWFIYGAAIFSGFFILNSIFLWPKLVTVAITVLSFILLLQKGQKDNPGIRVLFGSAAAAVANLFHGGVMFSLIALAIMLLFKPYQLKIKHIVLGIAVFLLLSAPWGAYKHFYDPPGDRLLKWHFAGQVDVTDQSFIKAVEASYRSLTFKQFIHNRLENIKAIVTIMPIKYALNPTKIRVYSFFNTFFSLGILNIGFLMIIYRFFNYLKNKKEFLTPSISLPLLFVGITLAIWVALMYIPGSTIIHQGSYTMMLFLFFSASLLTTELPDIAVSIIYYLNIIIFILVWGASNLQFNMINIPHLVIAIIFGSAIVVLLERLKNSDGALLNKI